MIRMDQPIGAAIIATGAMIAASRATAIKTSQCGGSGLRWLFIMTILMRFSILNNDSFQGLDAAHLILSEFLTVTGRLAFRRRRSVSDFCFRKAVFWVVR